MSQEEEIDRLIEIAKETKDLNIVNNIIYNLSAYGPKSIPAINEIMDDSSDSGVRLFGTQAIEKILEHNRQVEYFSRHY
jgi:hypothetical protein